MNQTQIHRTEVIAERLVTNRGTYLQMEYGIVLGQRGCLSKVDSFKCVEMVHGVLSPILRIVFVVSVEARPSQKKIGLEQDDTDQKPLNNNLNIAGRSAVPETFHIRISESLA